MAGVTRFDAYERETRTGYQSASKAASYLRQTRRYTWAKVATERQMAIVGRYLARCRLERTDYVMDAPCGTGIAGPWLRALPASVIAGDISLPMMALATGEYDSVTMRGFVALDMQRLPFADASITCAVVLGFMHRLPGELKRTMLTELARVVKGHLIVTFSVDSFAQRVKRGLLRVAVGPGYTAPVPETRGRIEELVTESGFAIREASYPVRGLSSVLVLRLERSPTESVASRSAAPATVTVTRQPRR